MKRSEVAPRVRAGGVVIAKHRLIKACEADPSDNLVDNRKLRIVGLPHRKAARLARTQRSGLKTKKR